ncbi:MAG: hypothetical protein ACKVU2_03915 [Saprospiraceae bacterium]
MTRTHSLLFFLLALAAASVAQGPGRLWLGGYNEFPGTPGYGHLQIRVLDDTVLVEPTALAFNFESTSAAMTDSAGNLLFYTNGCSVANRQHQVMPNGEGLNPGALGDAFCSGKGYPVPQGAMILPDPGGQDRYLILHMGASYDPVRKIRLAPLYYSVVDMSLENGLGDVTSKNKGLLAGDLGSFTVVRHGNGRDWWLIAPEFGNGTWHVFLLNPDGFLYQFPQNVSLPLPGCEKHICTAASLQGDRIANWGDCKVTVLDFDRCTGTLGNVLELPAPTHWIPGGGLAFSPTGRYLYATSQNVLFRADLQADPPGVVRLDTVRYSYDPINKSLIDVPGNTFHALVNGPDGRIYGNIPSRARHLHALRSPDSDSISVAALDFRARGVPLPVANVRTLPHLPNYRLTSLPNGPCDTLGIVRVSEAPTPVPTFSVIPNPAKGVVMVQCPNCPGGGLLRTVLRNALGVELRSGNHNGNTFRLETTCLPPGFYALELWQNGRFLGSKKVVLLGE